MPVNIIEIKAKCKNTSKIREVLKEYAAKFIGTDHQIDTYFNVPIGRLKLREGNIENTLIHYNRPNQEGPKNSQVTYQRLDASTPNLKAVLSAAIGILVVVDKKREIYFVDNIKFHIDEVQQLGTFVEIEAIDELGTMSLNKLQEQCEYFMKLFKIDSADLVKVSYSDLLLKNTII